MFKPGDLVAFVPTNRSEEGLAGIVGVVTEEGVEVHCDSATHKEMARCWPTRSPMKVTITNKGEGFIEVRYSAESPIESVMLSTAPLTSSETSAELKTDTQTDWSKTPASTRSVAYLTLHAWRVECHNMIQGVEK